MSMTKYMSVREAARATGIAESLIRSKIKQNAIPGFYSGRKFVINVPAFLASLEEVNPEQVTSPTTGKSVPTGSPKENEPSLRDILKVEIRNVTRDELRNIVREELRDIVREELRSILIEALK